MEEKEVELTRSFWDELLSLYDEFMRTGKTDEKTISMLEKSNLLTAGTKIGEEIMENFPQLDYVHVEGLVRQGIREKIFDNLRHAPDDSIE
jgi:ribosome biogenesis protein Nip4